MPRRTPTKETRVYHMLALEHLMVAREAQRYVVGIRKTSSTGRMYWKNIQEREQQHAWVFICLIKWE